LRKIFQEISVQTFELTHPAVAQATVIDDPTLVAAHLAQLHPDLTPALFLEAIRAGLGARNEATPASAPTAAGVQQWFKTVHDLRTLLSARQWSIHNENNCPFIISPDRRICIVAMTGDGEAGRSGEQVPTNQAEKGAVAQSFIKTNGQLEIFDQKVFNSFSKEHQGTKVWILLYHYDRKVNEVRYELSLPVGFDRKKITAWDIRLILGSIPNNPSSFTIDDAQANAPATVEVEPRTGTL